MCACVRLILRLLLLLCNIICCSTLTGIWDIDICVIITSIIFSFFPIMNCQYGLTQCGRFMGQSMNYDPQLSFSFVIS